MASVWRSADNDFKSIAVRARGGCCDLGEMSAVDPELGRSRVGARRVALSLAECR